MTQAPERYRRFLETLSPESLDRLPQYVRDDVRFADPFHDVRGAEDMARVFHHMFDTLGPVRFSVDQLAGDGNSWLMHWTFAAQLRNRAWTFDGCSRVVFDDAGLVIEHIDYWDSALLYERLPLIRPLFPALRRRVSRS